MEDQVEQYENVYSSTAREDGKKLIEALSPQKGNKVLHIGCATGYLTKYLASLVGPGGKVIGVDPDLGRLKLAREKYHDTNLEYLEGKAEAIPGNESEFDIVFSTYVLHWCKDIDAVLKASAARMKSGGKFGFVGITDKLKTHLTPESMFSQEFRTAFASKIFPINLDKLEELVLANGFMTTLRKIELQEMTFKDVNDLVGYYITHFHGLFDKTHFNTEAMKQRYGDGNVCVQVEIVTAVLVKQ